MVRKKKPRSAPVRPASPDPLPGWYTALEACRRLDSGGTVVTARGLAAELGISLGFASAWCSKFVDWGYLRFVGKILGRRGRAAKSYALTAYGLERKPPKFSRRLGAGDDTCPTCGQPLPRE